MSRNIATFVWIFKDLVIPALSLGGVIYQGETTTENSSQAGQRWLPRESDAGQYVLMEGIGIGPGYYNRTARTFTITIPSDSYDLNSTMICINLVKPDWGGFVELDNLLEGANDAEQCKDISLLDSQSTTDVSFTSLGSVFPYSVRSDQGEQFICVHETSSYSQRWNATLLLQYLGDGKLMFTMEEFDEFRERYRFSYFLVELITELDDVLLGNHTVLSYREDQSEARQLHAEFVLSTNHTELQLWARVTPIDCRCIDMNDATINKCHLRSNTVTVRPIFGQEKDMVKQENGVVYAVLALLFSFAAILHCITKAWRRSQAGRSKGFSTEQEEEPLITSSSQSHLDVELVEDPPPVLLLYSFSDARITEEAANLRLHLKEALKCTVYDYGDENQADELNQLGPTWFVTKLSDRGIKIVVVLSASTDHYEKILLDPERKGFDLVDPKDSLCFSSLAVLLGMTCEDKNYDRVFCIRFAGIDDNCDLRTLVPLTRYVLPQHVDLLVTHLRGHPAAAS